MTNHPRGPDCTEEDILWCLYSISDNNSYLLFNRWVIQRDGLLRSIMSLRLSLESICRLSALCLLCSTAVLRVR